MKNKNITISLVLFSCLLSITQTDLSARRTSSSRSTSSRSKSNSNSRASVNTAPVAITTSVVQEAPPVAEAAPVAEVAPVVTEVVPVAAVAVAPVEVVAEQPKDIAQDAQWESFRICMQQYCSQGADQPNNVQCYRSVNFDNAFMSCSALVDTAKRNDFKEYFNGPFILNEKRDFCKGEYYKGSFDEATQTCNLTVTYTRAAVETKVKNSDNGCKAAKVSKVWAVNGNNYTCKGEDFGVKPCYNDSANVEAAQIKKVTGTISTVLGTAAVAIPILTTGFGSGPGVNTTTQEEYVENGQTFTKTVNVTAYNDGQYGVTQDQLDKAHASATWGSVGTGLAQGSGMLTSGITDLVGADMMEKEKGAREYGQCILPDGRVIQENQMIPLQW